MNPDGDDIMNAMGNALNTTDPISTSNLLGFASALNKVTSDSEDQDADAMVSFPMKSHFVFWLIVTEHDLKMDSLKGSEK